MDAIPPDEMARYEVVIDEDVVSARDVAPATQPTAKEWTPPTQAGAAAIPTGDIQVPPAKEEARQITHLTVYRNESGNPDEYGPEVELTTQEVDDFARGTAVSSVAYIVPTRP